MDKHEHSHTQPEGYDNELHYGAIVKFGVGLVVVTVVALLAMWWMSDAFKKQAEADDPPPSPIAEAHLDPIPPGPRLQSAPPRDMNEMRQGDQEALTTYGWVNQAAGVAHIPVSRAKEILLATGLPRTPAPQATAAPQAAGSAAPTAGSAAPASSAAPHGSASSASSAAPRGSASPADKKKGTK